MPLTTVVRVRRLREGDLVFAVGLANREGWGYTRRDFRRLLTLEPSGCFIAAVGGSRVGMLTTSLHGGLGWIGNVVVSRRYRGRGIGSLLVKHALQYLKGRGVPRVGLYAYLHARGFYRRLGFREDAGLVSFAGRGRRMDFAGVRRVARGDVAAIEAFDEEYFGAPRGRFLRGILREYGELCFLAESGGRLLGYAMGGGSGGLYDLGPWVCMPGEGVAEDLLGAFLSRVGRGRVELTVPSSNRRALEVLRGAGFEEVRRVVRMYYDGARHAGRDEGVFAIGSLAQG